MPRASVLPIPTRRDGYRFPKYARLESAGYRNIEKIERESGSYEVKATDLAGRRIKLYVHPQTGEVIDQRQRDKYDSGYAKTVSAILLTATSDAAVMTGPKREPSNPSENDPSGVLT